MSTLEQRVARLEQEVASLRARDGVRKTLSLYAIAVDEKQPDLLAGLFARKAVLTIPAWQVEARGRDAIMRFFDEYWGRFDYPRRYYANEDVVIDGECASAFMYWHVTQEREGRSVLGWGTYDWNFRRVGERWLITKEVVNILAMTTLDRGWAGPNKLAPF